MRKKVLKCPICGKMYAYESKICTECEEYAIRSGLTSKKAPFSSTYPFRGTRRFIKVEHHEYRVKEPFDYGWNCCVPLEMEVDVENELFFSPIELLGLPLDKRANLTLYFE